MRFETERGVVVAYDDHVGWGIVRGTSGIDLGFHCTALADGSRTIEVGVDVAYRIVPNGPGRWEATSIVR